MENEGNQGDSFEIQIETNAGGGGMDSGEIPIETVSYTTREIIYTIQHNPGEDPPEKNEIAEAICWF